VALAAEAMMQEHDRDLAAWLTEWTSLPELCLLSAKAIAGASFVMSNLVVKPERMRHNYGLGEGAIMAEALMLKLGDRIGRLRAHEILYELSMKVAEHGTPFRAALLADPRVAEHFGEADIEAILDPAPYVEAAAACVDRVTERAEQGFQEYGRTLEERQRRWRPARRPKDGDGPAGSTHAPRPAAGTRS
jgi:3-carboxy-cis,cis-muconate cycloisomerase